MITFYLTIVWAIGYWIVYPAWPLISSNTTGLFGYSSRADVAVELANLEKIRGDKMAALGARLARRHREGPGPAGARAGQRQDRVRRQLRACHGTRRRRRQGLSRTCNDDDWLWGGTLDQIMQTIQFGARSGHAKAHEGQMLAFGKDGVLKPDEIVTVANYVRVAVGPSDPQGL